MMHYKIVHGFDAEQITPIDEDELEKAYGLFLLGGRAIFRNGAVDSKYIQRITPDWHKIMGWASGYDLGPDDYNELADKGIDRQARQLQSRTQEKVQYLIQSKKENLIGTNTEIPELQKPTLEIRGGGMKRIGDFPHPTDY